MKKKIFTLGLLVMILMALAGEAGAQCCVAPTNLRVRSISRHEAELRWNRVTQVGCTTPTKYRVQYRVKGTTTWTTIIVRTKKDDVRGDTSVRNLTPSTTYQWRVQGICSSTSKTAFIAGPDFTTLAFAVSSAVTSSSPQNKLSVTASPNPAVSVLNLTGHAKETGPVEIQIISQTGFMVFHKSYNFNSYDFSTSIDVSKFQKGTYMVRVNGKTEKASLTIIKE